MATYMPFVVVGLALIAAISIAVLAWELTDETLHDELAGKAHPPEDKD